ncbi:MAG: DUF523 and DUF1722 domain-containing protein [Candidatus Coatesbacteria bacterium]|nr:DUF523 and DUF1722 domain-containing protein [Candidatus Coatesbacteria bacterium]
MGDTEFAKPRIFISKCLGFEACRWNGISLPQDAVDRLRDHADILTTCPEVEIGLGIPRKPIRIVEPKGEERRLMQSETGLDVTDEMNTYCDAYLRSLPEIDGFILKSKSPSCGVNSVKVYPGPSKVAALTTSGNGFFGSKVLEYFPNAVLEDEGRLRNLRIREDFLTRVFALARFRQLKAKGKVSDLVQFQASNKFLLMAYNQKEMRELGRVVANRDKLPLNEVIGLYDRHLRMALQKTPRVPSIINALMHGLGYFSKEITPGEREFFLKSLEDYRADKIPLSGALNVLQSWAIRFDNEYLLSQTFFRPFPEALIDQGGTCKR